MEEKRITFSKNKASEFNSSNVFNKTNNSGVAYYVNVANKYEKFDSHICMICMINLLASQLLEEWKKCEHEYDTCL